MKRTLSILLSITVLFSIFVLPTSASASTNTEIDIKSAKAITIGTKNYVEKDLSLLSQYDNLVYKVTANTSGVYKFYTKSADGAYVDAALYKPNNLGLYKYVKYCNNFEIKMVYYLNKGETLYLKIALYRPGNYYYRNNKFDLMIDRVDNCVAKDGILYMENEDSYKVIDYYFTSPTNVKIAETINNKPVTIIDDYAFSRCNNVISITTSKNIEKIGDYAFYKCLNLNKVNLLNGLEKIGNYSFDGTKIQSLHLPKSVKDISPLVNPTSLKSITVDNNNYYYLSIDGVLFSKDKKNLYIFPGRKSTSYTIPKGTECIFRYAFSNSIIENVTLPSTVKVLDIYSFEYCYKLRNVKLNEGLKEIDFGAFRRCYSLNFINIPSTVKKIEGYAFGYCGLRTITIPDSSCEIEGNAFYSSLEYAVFKGKNVTLNYNPFNSKIKTIYAPNDSTAKTLASTIGVDFVATDYNSGDKCTNHKYIMKKVIKEPNCLNCGVISIECAICHKSGPNQKIVANNHVFNSNTVSCSLCGTSGNIYISAELNKKYNNIVNMSDGTQYTYNSSVLFYASKAGNYSFNINSITDKISMYYVIDKQSQSYTEVLPKLVENKCKTTLKLDKGDSVIFQLTPILNYPYYEPVRVNFSVTCNHLYKNTVVKPTYVSGGYTLHKCSTCGYSYKDKKTAKLKLQTPSGLTLKSGKKSLTVSYKKVTKATGYQIQYSLNSNFKSAKTVKINKNATTKTTIKKLTSNKKYYVRLRSYVVQNKKIAYSEWSKSKNTKVK